MPRSPIVWSDRALWRRLLLSAGAMLCISGSAWLAFTISERHGMSVARVDANHRLDLFSAAMQGVVKRLEPVPATVQLNPDVVQLLREPSDGKRAAAVGDYLRRLSAHVGSLAVFVLDARGVVMASSDAVASDDSRRGEDLSFRPYFLDALSGRVGRHFAIGVSGSRPGYFVAHPIHDGTRVVGVAAIKIGLEAIDHTWAMLGAPGLVTDSNRVVIMASDRRWRYTALDDLSPERRADLQLTRLYGDLRVARFPIAMDVPWEAESRLLRGLRMPGTPSPRDPGAGTLLLVRPVDGMDWRILLFADLGPARQLAWMSGTATAIASSFVMLLLTHLAQRRRGLRQRLESKRLLEQANTELERKVVERTGDLTAANARLRVEIAEREQAERSLRTTHNELVHAAKMAVLGQLSASITHELTQPLGAIRTLSGNALEFQRRGAMEPLAGNLQHIARLADKMGSIISPLKSFARKAQARPSAVDIALAMHNALFLYGPALRKDRVELVNRCVPGQVFAWCDADRLEQVLINLVGNAIDAMQPVDRRVLTVDAVALSPAGSSTATSRVRIHVQDSGTGFTESVRLRLFEPFFTTKAGNGLGLGLVISRDIMREFGGDLDATSGADGGARFVIELPAAPSPDLRPVSSSVSTVALRVQPHEA